MPLLYMGKASSLGISARNSSKIYASHAYAFVAQRKSSRLLIGGSGFRNSPGVRVGIVSGLGRWTRELSHVDVTQLVEYELAKFVVAGSNPVIHSRIPLRKGHRALGAAREGFAPLAQLVEHRSCKADVIGSNPIGGSINATRLERVACDWEVATFLPGMHTGSLER